MAKSTARHERETAAIAGKLYGVNRDYVRMSKVCERELSPEQLQAIRDGHVNLKAAYNWLRGETRVGVHVLVQPELREAINTEAARRGITRQALLEYYLTQIFGEGVTE